MASLRHGGASRRYQPENRMYRREYILPPLKPVE
jgi:hypothetical protein